MEFIKKLIIVGLFLQFSTTAYANTCNKLLGQSNLESSLLSAIDSEKARAMIADFFGVGLQENPGWEYGNDEPDYIGNSFFDETLSFNRRSEVRKTMIADDGSKIPMPGGAETIESVESILLMVTMTSPGSVAFRIHNIPGRSIHIDPATYLNGPPILQDNDSDHPGKEIKFEILTSDLNQLRLLETVAQRDNGAVQSTREITLDKNSEGRITSISVNETYVYMDWIENDSDTVSNVYMEDEVITNYNLID